jgi:hypothetical protein
VRIPQDLHQMLLDNLRDARIKARSSRGGKMAKPSLNALIVQALRRDCDLQNISAVPLELKGDDLLAYKCLCLAPAPIVIKGSDSIIRWPNLEYQAMAGLSQNALRGHKLEDLGFVTRWEAGAIQNDIDSVLASNEPASFLEFVYVSSRRSKVPFATHRFAFSVSGHTFLGDVSFDWTTMTDGARKVHPELLHRFRRAMLPPDVDHLFLPFFLHSPTAMVVKNAKGQVQLYNWEYAALAGRSRESDTLSCLKGLTAREIWNLGPAHEVVSNDDAVIRNNVWMYTHEVISDSIGPRVSLRFPIPGPDGRPEQIGVISTTAGRQRYQANFTFRGRDDRSPRRA